MNENTETDPGATELQTAPDTRGSSSHRHSRHGEHGARRRRSQRLVLGIALVISVFLLIVVGVSSAIRVGSLSADNDALSEELFQVKQELEKVKPQLEQARKELSNSTQGRLPHLRELVPDKVIAVDTAYVKNIVFTPLRSSDGTRFEYRMVLENKSDSLVRPEVRVFIFDERGVQVGGGEVSDRADMTPGESRSYSGAIERFMEEPPRYFYVWARTKKAVEGARK
jgi:cell division protein FtsB